MYLRARVNNPRLRAASRGTMACRSIRSSTGVSVSMSAVSTSGSYSVPCGVMSLCVVSLIKPVRFLALGVYADLDSALPRQERTPASSPVQEGFELVFASGLVEGGLLGDLAGLYEARQ